MASEGSKGFRIQPAHFATVICIMLVLFLMGLFGLVVIYANELSRYVKEEMTYSLYIKDGFKEVDVIQFKKKLDATSYILEAEYLTKEKAMQNWLKDIGPEEDFQSLLDGQIPLPSSIEIRLHSEYSHPDSIQWIQNELMKNEMISDMGFDNDLLHKIENNLQPIRLIILAVTGCLLLIVFALINNTIRLSIYSKRFLIRSMQLIGATEGFIAWPFVWRGVLQGVIGAILAIAVLAGIVHLGNEHIPGIRDLQRNDYNFILAGFVTILGIVIAWISTYFAVRSYLRKQTDALYF